MMDRRYCLVTVVVTSLLVTQTGGTSDTSATLCDPVCWEEEALSDQCVENRCSAKQNSPRLYRQCEDRCWGLVAPCRLLCRQHSDSVLHECYSTCESQRATASDEECPLNCFLHTMLVIKARDLPGPFTPGLTN